MRDYVILARVRARAVAMIAVAGLAMSCVGSSAALGADIKQSTYSTPEEATAALVDAVRVGGDPLVKVFGADSRRYLTSGDKVADRVARENFVVAFEEAHRLETQPDGRIVLYVGKDDWPLPIPLVKAGAGWRFDAQAGREEIANRRIGRNELAAIQVCLAFVDAQHEYASEDRDGDGIRAYTPRFVSRKGTKDGLYWPSGPGEVPSPLGEFVAAARAEGYTRSESGPTPFHGYVYRILTKQGDHAPGRAYDYIVRGKMIGGFALVAYPVRYGVSGVMTFIVNHGGVVYQKNLGPDTVTIAGKMTVFDPDPSWTKP